jgi:hypothetical protein
MKTNIVIHSLSRMRLQELMTLNLAVHPIALMEEQLDKLKTYCILAHYFLRE